MAELDTGGGKKVSTRVDMTPMVDLAFLLITFFMLTTTFSKPKAMEVNMPDKSEKKDDKIKVAASLTTTFLLSKGDQIFYYQGEGEEAKIQELSYNPSSLREFLKKDIQRTYREKGKDPIYIIKADKSARYKNIVDMLDEMSIISNYQVIQGGQTKKAAPAYALVDITPDDDALINKYRETMGVK